MPATKILFYKEINGTVPIIVWLERQSPKRVKAKCLELIRLLARKGYELRRPHADILRGGIHELRTRFGRVNYRMLYFFNGRNCVVLTHGLTKEAAVPDSEMERAIRMKCAYEKDPDNHRYAETEQYYEENFED